MANQVEATNVTTGQVRLSYVHLFTPYANKPGQEPKYSTTILLPKSDLATKQRIDAAIQVAAQKGVSTIWNGARPPQLKTPLWDGDGARQSGEPFGPECKGHWVFTASSKSIQAIVDANMNPIINQSDVYSGMYARVSINFFPFSNSGNRGVGCGLGPVQKLGDGESLSGQISAEQAFGGMQSPAQPAYQQPQQPAAYGQAPPYPQVAQPQYAQQPQQGYGQPQQPIYAPPVQPSYAPQQPTYAQPQTQPQIARDPITGQPLGGVLGV